MRKPSARCGLAQEVMDRKLRCIEPRCLVLLVTSILFLPLRDSLQTALRRSPLSTTTGCSSMRPQQQPPTRRPGDAPLPTRRLPRLLRPLKGSGSEEDVSRNGEPLTGKDDSMKVVDEPSAIAAAAAAAGGPVGSATEEGEGGDAGQAQAAAPAAVVDRDVNLDLEAEVASFEFAPPMTVRKFKTMQDRRVPVTIKYSGGGGFKAYFEEIAMVLKRHFPDVIIDREIVEVSSMREEEVFEIRVDGKLVCAKRRGKPGVFLHMETFVQAIRKARQRRRPGSIVYGDQETYQNVKALTDQRTADDSLERGFKNFTPEAGSGDAPTA